MAWIKDLVTENLINGEVLRPTFQLESVISEAGKKKTKPTFPIGKPEFYTIISKRIRITATDYNFDADNISYSWNGVNLHIKHNMDGIVDYVLRFKSLNRIECTDILVDSNELIIKFPEYLQSDLSNKIPPNITVDFDVWCELIIYKISEIPSKINAFKYIMPEFDSVTNKLNNSYSYDIQKLNSEVIDSILRNDQQRVLFHSKLNETTITYVYPESYTNLNFNNLVIYTSYFKESIKIKKTFLIRKNNTYAILIKHKLPGIVKAVLRYGSNKSMFMFNDYVEPGSIYVYWPDTDINKFDDEFIIDLYTIYK